MSEEDHAHMQQAFGVVSAESDTNVDEMKIQTMYKMVEECKCSVGGSEVKKRVMYLTNKQASLFDEQAMMRCIQALEIGEPKFVINLLPSLGVRSQMNIAHQERKMKPAAEYVGSTSLSSELTVADERTVETQILLFMKMCILPLAMKTKALILVGGANDCYLGAALSNVALSEQVRLGKDCPFTVVAFVAEFEIHHKAVSVNEKGSLSAQIATGSMTWKKRILTVDKALRARSTNFQYCDLTPAASQYIIFECLNEFDGKLESGPKKNFSSIFLHCMTRNVPSIAVQAFKIDEGVAHLARLAARCVPILLLDSTERAFTMRNTLSSGIPTQTDLAKAASNFAIISIENLKRIKVSNEVLTLSGRAEMLSIAKDMVERKWRCYVQGAVTDVFDCDMLAFFHSVLILGTELGSNSTLVEGEQGMPLGQRIKQLEKYARANKDSNKELIPHALASNVILFLQSRSAALDIMSKLAKVEAWLQNHDPKVEDLVAGAIKYRDNLRRKVNEIEASGGLLIANIDPATWLTNFDLLTSPYVHSGSIFDIDHLKHTLSKIAKTDRLPASDSIEALRIIRVAWDNSEMYHSFADHYKRITKVTYVAMLLIGVAVTAVSLCEGFLKSNTRYCVIALSFASTAIVSYVTFVNPAMKWQQLRMAALGIESNIWYYRTRAGPYRGEGDVAERLLSHVVQDIKSTVLSGADVKLTSFYSQTIVRNKHGQNHESTESSSSTIEGGIGPGPASPARPNVEESFSSASATSSGRPHQEQKLVSPTKEKGLSGLFRRANQDSDDEDDDEDDDNDHGDGNVVEAGADIEHGRGGGGGAVSIRGENPMPLSMSSETSSFAAAPRSMSGKHRKKKNRRHSEPLMDVELSYLATDSSESILDSPSFQHYIRKLHGDTIPPTGIPLTHVISWIRRRKGVDDEDVQEQDSHYEPVQPDSYIAFRVRIALQFYKNRIPRASRLRNIAQVLLVIGSLGTGILGIANLSSWAPLVSIFGLGVTAFLEFHGTNGKMARYSSTVNALQSLIEWWDALPQIDRFVVHNTDKLVQTCEEILQKEQQSWRSTSQAMKMLAREAGADNKGNSTTAASAVSGDNSN